MSTIASYIFGGGSSPSLAPGTCGFTNSDAGEVGAPPSGSQFDNGVGESFDNESATSRTSFSVSESGALLEGMLVGVPSSSNAHGREDESSYAGQTILSSAASNATFMDSDQLGHAPRNSDPYDPPPPRGGYPLSVSTASSYYMDLDDRQEVVVNPSIRQQIPPTNLPDSSETFKSLSFHGSLMDSSLTIVQSESGLSAAPNQTMTGQQNPRSANEPSLMRTALTGFEPHPQPPTAIVLPQPDAAVAASRTSSNWYSNFNDGDWDQLRRQANMAIQAMGLARAQQRLLRPWILPPSPPPSEQMTLSLDPRQKVHVPAMIPSCFVCPICENAIVGALTLDCACGTTVCSACWEYRSAAKGADVYALARGLDYEVVSSRQQPRRNDDEEMESTCPCCAQDVQSPVACHALDVAILQVVRSLNASDYKLFQQLYYERLRYWRDEIKRRQNEMAQATHPSSGCTTSDGIIAQLIQEEERQWHGQRQCANAVRYSLPGTIGVLVAMVATVGLRVLAQTRADIRRI